ncbi:hypothetical protein QOU18_20410, partial [Pseudomonas aeruginosa]
MPKRLLPWMALCACSPLLAAPTVPEARLQQLAADPYQAVEKSQSPRGSGKMAAILFCRSQP